MPRAIASGAAGFIESYVGKHLLDADVDAAALHDLDCVVCIRVRGLQRGLHSEVTYPTP